MISHIDDKLKSLELHKLVAAKLKTRPELLMQASQILSRWRERCSPRVLDYLDEWEHIINAGVDECIKVSISESEHSADLRQSSPLACLLTIVERNNFIISYYNKEYKDETCRP